MLTAIVRASTEYALALVAPPACAACDAPVRIGVAFCGPCAATLAPLHSPAAAFAYGGALQQAIVRMKYQGRSDLARTLGRLLAQHASQHWSSVAWIVPVPLYPHRLYVRGYNQSALLAGPVALALGAALRPGLLHRVRATEAQAGLAQASREGNVLQAFRARSPGPGRILLIDDVRTTGSTLRACTSALYAAGAFEVCALALAQA